MLEWTPGRRFYLGVQVGAGIGLLAGAFEVAGLASSLKQPCSEEGFAAAGLAALLAMALAGAAISALAGLVPFALLRRQPASVTVSLQASATALVVGGVYLWEHAQRLWCEGRTGSAFGLAAMPLAVAAVAWGFARLGLRRAEGGNPLPVGWTALSVVVSLAAVASGFAIFASRGPTGATADEGRPNALLITIDGLRADEPIPWLASERVILYEDAVTPIALSGPANASALTGMHPLRLRWATEDGRLGRGFLTLAEALSQKGYATAAFVGRSALGPPSGLDQGFDVFDEGEPVLAPLADALLLTRGVLALAGRDARGRRRAPELTIDAFEAWLDGAVEVSWFAWFHVGEAGLPVGAEGEAPGRAAEIEGLLDRIDAILSERGLSGETMVVLAGAYGVSRGEGADCGGSSGTLGLSDEVVRVPVAVRAPSFRPVVTRITAQVRLFDVAPTVAEWMGSGALAQAEGVDLLPYALGAADKPLIATLVGRATDDPRERPLVGARSEDVKYVRDLRTGTVRLYDLESDPDERTDVSASQPATLEKAWEITAAEQAALERILAEDGPCNATR